MGGSLALTILPQDARTDVADLTLPWAPAAVISGWGDQISLAEPSAVMATCVLGGGREKGRGLGQSPAEV